MPATKPSAKSINFLQSISLAAVTLVLLWLNWQMFQGFIGALVMAFLIAGLLQPWHKKIKAKTGGIFSSIILICGVFVVLAVPISVLTSLVITESQQFVESLQKIDFNSLNLRISALGQNFDFSQVLTSIQSNLSQIAQVSGGLLLQASKSLSEFGFKFALFWYFLFYFILDFSKTNTAIQKLIPLPKNTVKGLSKKTAVSIKAIFQGNFLASLAGFIASLIGFSIIGLPGKVIFALITGILSLFPTIGSLLGYILAISSSYFILGASSSLMLLSYFIIVDQVIVNGWLRGKLIDDKLKMHPILVFISVFAGVSIFGNLGLFYGPILVIFAKSVLEQIQEQVN